MAVENVDAGAAKAPAASRAWQAHLPKAILLAVAAGCIVAFAWWLEATLRPALAARERGQPVDAASVQHSLEYSHVPPESCVTSSVQWCGAIGVMTAHVKAVSAAADSIVR